jgi:hypothetical protein
MWIGLVTVLRAAHDRSHSALWTTSAFCSASSQSAPLAAALDFQCGVAGRLGGIQSSTSTNLGS